MVQVYT